MIYSIEVAAEPPDRDLLPAGGLRGGVAGRLPPGRRRAAAAMPARDRGVGGVAPTRPEPAVRGRRLAGREWLRFLSRGRQSRPGDQPVAPPPRGRQHPFVHPLHARLGSRRGWLWADGALRAVRHDAVRAGAGRVYPRMEPRVRVHPIAWEPLQGAKQRPSTGIASDA